MASALSRRLGRIERALPPSCPACARRPVLPGVLFRYKGRLTDGRGNDIDPAALEPCPRCGRGGDGKAIAGLNPAAMMGTVILAGPDPESI